MHMARRGEKGHKKGYSYNNEASVQGTALYVGRSNRIDSESIITNIELQRSCTAERSPSTVELLAEPRDS